jgi:DtxR family Mn-dependent transcriptional regulator
VSLSELKPGSQSQVAAVRDTSSSFLQYLQKLNIGIGTKIQLIEKIPYDNSLVIKIENREDTTVSQKFGENILVD